MRICVSLCLCVTAPHFLPRCRCLLRKERMELLHRALDVERLPGDLRPPAGGVLHLPTSLGGTDRSTVEVESELNRLDEAIRDEKRQLLRLAMKVEQRNLEEEED